MDTGPNGGADSWLFTLFENYSFVTIYILLLPKIILKKTEIFGQKYEIKKVECWEIVLRKKHEIVQNSKTRNIVVECILTMSKFHTPNVTSAFLMKQLMQPKWLSPIGRFN
jgi:hypothetical protein